jgi:DNA modification methylase
MSEKLFLGDCNEILSALDIDYDKAIFVSDPPFNIGYHYNEYKDNMVEKDYFAMLANLFGKHNHVLIHYPESLYQHSANIGKVPKRVVSWVYNSNTAKQHRDIAFFGVEPLFRNIGQEYKNPNDKRIIKLMAEGKSARLYDWWEINQVKNVSAEKTEHPCQMPYEVMRRIIGILPSDFVIIDPFMGSGTTGVACQSLGRDFIGIEIDSEYYEIAKQRITNTTEKGITE